MTNIDRAADVLADWADSEGGLSAIDRDYDGDLTGGVEALADAGLLTPEPRIIRTREELAALDPEAILFRPYDDAHDTIMNAVEFLSDYDIDPDAVLPAVVIATGDHVRAARQTLEEA